MALDAGGPLITTLEELIPLLEGVTTAKEFGWVILQNVPAKPRTLKGLLARAACSHFGHKWTDNVLIDCLKPSYHSEKRANAHRVSNRSANAAWRQANPYYKVNYQRSRLANDPAYKTAQLLRTRLWSAVKAGGAGKSASTMELTGCNLPELMAHLESKFTDGMTWANQGEWHIDHIKPCASFDMMDPEQQRQCFHWTNLQPLWGADNMSKGDRLDWSPNDQIEPQDGPTASNL